MKNKLGLISLRSKVALIGVLYVLKRPSYIGGMIIGIFASSSLVIWSLNLELVGYILFEAPITLADKLQFFGSTYRDIFTTYESNQALGIVIFSVLFGINIAMLVFVLKNQGFKDIPKKSGFGGTIFAVLSGGCVACGTSLLAPIAATFGATSGAFLRELALWLNWASSILIIYSIYKLGQLVATIKAKKSI